tara:strand:- start:845 stop:1243 length:399 start_codon:yes stop_codon:yes gene_type:complete
MSEYSVTILQDQAIVLLELTGTVTLSVLLEVAEGVYAHADYRPEFSAVIDQRHANFELNYEDLYSYLYQINENPNRLQGDTVFVTEKSLGFGMARMYENMESDEFADKIFFAETVEEAFNLLANRRDQRVTK